MWPHTWPPQQFTPGAALGCGRRQLPTSPAPRQVWAVVHTPGCRRHPPLQASLGATPKGAAAGAGAAAAAAAVTTAAAVAAEEGVTPRLLQGGTSAVSAPTLTAGPWQLRTDWGRGWGRGRGGAGAWGGTSGPGQGPAAKGGRRTTATPTLRLRRLALTRRRTTCRCHRSTARTRPPPPPPARRRRCRRRTPRAAGEAASHPKRPCMGRRVWGKVWGKMWGARSRRCRCSMQICLSRRLQRWNGRGR